MFLFPFEQRIDQTVENFLRAAVAQVQHRLAALFTRLAPRLAQAGENSQELGQ